jgi:predicted NUDIX family NTP pyrophosphohydrolase
MARKSAGLLVYRKSGGSLEVFLVHPGGPFWAAKDLGAWSIPKGELEAGKEDALAAARREFGEETGFKVDGPFVPLSAIRQPGGKIVLAWGVEGDFDPADMKSNVFSLEWPPRSGRTREFPEADRGAWFGIEEAKGRILAGQIPLLDELETRLAAGKTA